MIYFCILIFVAPKSVFTLNELQIDSYPNIQFSDSQVNFTIDAINLKQMIRKYEQKSAEKLQIKRSGIVVSGIRLESGTVLSLL